MMRKPVDAETHALATRVIAESRRHGVDAVEALYRAGLLSTPAEDRSLQVNVIQDILMRLHALRPADFLRRKHKGSLEQRTLQDLYDTIVDWLEEYVKELETL